MMIFKAMTDGQSSNVSHILNCSIFLLLVIGRGGEQINKLQSETGAKIQVAPGNEITCVP